jgi:hypothetical protein
MLYFTYKVRFTLSWENDLYFKCILVYTSCIGSISQPMLDWHVFWQITKNNNVDAYLKTFKTQNDTSMFLKNSTLKNNV